MKTYEESLAEMTDVVTKLVWNYTVFCGLFEKAEVHQSTRLQHSEFFLTMYESLFGSFCMAARVLFNKEKSQDSLPNLINYVEVTKQKSDLAKILNDKIGASHNSLEILRKMRNKTFGHRNKADTQQQVWNEFRPRLDMMKEITNLAQFIILELAQEFGGERRENLEKQQLSPSTLRCIAKDATRVLEAFHEFTLTESTET
jgi:AbiU2